MLGSHRGHMRPNNRGEERPDAISLFDQWSRRRRLIQHSHRQHVFPLFCSLKYPFEPVRRNLQVQSMKVREGEPLPYKVRPVARGGVHPLRAGFVTWIALFRSGDD